MFINNRIEIRRNDRLSGARLTDVTRLNFVEVARALHAFFSRQVLRSLTIVNVNGLVRRALSRTSCLGLTLIREESGARLYFEEIQTSNIRQLRSPLTMKLI